MKTVFRKKRAKSLGLEEAAKFNHLLDTNQALQRGMEQLAFAYPYLGEKSYIEKALQLFREAGGGSVRRRFPDSAHLASANRSDAVGPVGE